MTPPREVIVLAAGDLQALATLLAGLPRDFSVPLALVLHRTPDEAEDILAQLQARSPLPVHEIEDKDPLRPGHAHLAPRGYHLLVDEDHLALSIDAPANGVRPSADTLFESASDVFHARVTAVVLSGASQDGALGSLAVKRRGGTLLVQNPRTAEHPLMPASVIAATSVDQVLELALIARTLVERLHVPQRKDTPRRSRLSVGHSPTPVPPSEGRTS